MIQRLKRSIQTAAVSTGVFLNAAAVVNICIYAAHDSEVLAHVC